MPDCRLATQLGLSKLARSHLDLSPAAPFSTDFVPLTWRQHLCCHFLCCSSSWCLSSCLWKVDITVGSRMLRSNWELARLRLVCTWIRFSSGVLWWLLKLLRHRAAPPRAGEFLSAASFEGVQRRKFVAQRTTRRQFSPLSELANSLSLSLAEATYRRYWACKAPDHLPKE